MAGLQNFRDDHPEYAGVDDKALADALYSTYYSSMPRDEYDAKMGVKPSSDVAPIMDTVGNVVRGIGQVPSQVGGLLGLATGNMDNAVRRFGQRIEDSGKGMQSKGYAAKEADLEARMKKADEENGFWGGLYEGAKGAVSDPYLGIGMLVQQVPGLVATMGGGYGAATAARVAASRAALRAGATAEAAAAAGTSAAEKWGLRAGIAGGTAQQTGDTANQTYDDIMKLSPEVLAKSEDYAKLRQTMPHEEALQTLATRGARIAAAVAAPASALSARLLPGVEKLAFGKKEEANVIARALKGGVGEFSQEGIEGFTGQYGQNLGAQQADPDRDLMQGVGTQTGQGAVLGGIMGGGTHVVLGHGHTPQAERGELPEVRAAMDLFAANRDPQAPELTAQQQAQLRQNAEIVAREYKMDPDEVMNLQPDQFAQLYSRAVERLRPPPADRYIETQPAAPVDPTITVDSEGNATAPPSPTRDTTSWELGRREMMDNGQTQAQLVRDRTTLEQFRRSQIAAEEAANYDQQLATQDQATQEQTQQQQQAEAEAQQNQARLDAQAQQQQDETDRQARLQQAQDQQLARQQAAQQTAEAARTSTLAPAVERTGPQATVDAAQQQRGAAAHPATQSFNPIVEGWVQDFSQTHPGEQLSVPALQHYLMQTTQQPVTLSDARDLLRDYTLSRKTGQGFILAPTKDGNLRPVNPGGEQVNPRTEMSAREAPVETTTNPDATPEEKAATEAATRRANRDKAMEVLNRHLDPMRTQGPQAQLLRNAVIESLNDRTLSGEQLYAGYIAATEMNRIMPSSGNHAVRFLRQLVAGDKNAAERSGGTQGMEIQGQRTAPSPGLRGLIELSLSNNMLGMLRETAAHEAFHVLQDYYRQYDPQFAKLMDASFHDGMTLRQIDPTLRRKLETTKHPENGEDNKPRSYWDAFGGHRDVKLSAREAQAYVFGALTDASRRGVPMSGLKPAFARFVNAAHQLLQRIGNTMRGDGFRNASDLFARAAEGDAKRFDAKASPQGAEAEASARRVWPGQLPNGDHEGRVSQRVPAGPNATEDPIHDNLRIDTETMMRNPALVAKAVPLIEGYLNYRPDPSLTTPEEKIKAFHDHLVRNILHLYDNVDGEIRDRSKLWYTGARKIAEQMATKYGLTDRQAAGVFAVLSPQKDWYQNVSLGTRVMDIFHTKQNYRFNAKMRETMERLFADPKYDWAKEIVHNKTLGELRGMNSGEKLYVMAMWVRTYDQTYNAPTYAEVSPEGGLGENMLTGKGSEAKLGWGSLNEIGKAIGIILNGSRENISDSVGDAHKVRNFFNNILAPNAPHGDLTNDTHAVAAALFRPLSGNSVEVAHGLGLSPKPSLKMPGAPDSKPNGTRGLYGIYADAYRTAAEQRGVLPREMQSITWEAIRGVFSPAFKRNKRMLAATEQIWQNYRDGAISEEEARSQIMQLVGGRIKPPSWFDGGRGIADDEDAGPADHAGDVSQLRVSGSEAGSGEAAPGGAGDGAAGRATARSRKRGTPEASARAVPAAADEGQVPERGGVSGGAGVLAASRGSGDEALQGLPKRVRAGAGFIEAGPFLPARRAAEDYTREAGLPYTPTKIYAKVDPERATRIADAYAAMPNAPNDPLVRAAYDAMAKETAAQWEAIKRTGFQAEFFPEGPDPYHDNPRFAIEDVKNNNHMFVFSTEAGYGETPITDADRAENPLLVDTGERWGGKPVLVNDLFRAVHDYFGHAKEGVGFRADGEENAWRSHAAMYSPLARLAMTSETRGQNSWLNYGPEGEKNRTAKTGDTVFADQKVGILPDWVQHEGAEDFLKPIDVAQLRRKAAEYSARQLAPAKVEDPGTDYYKQAVAKGLDMSHAARMKRARELGYTERVYHLTKTDFDAFRPSGPADFGIHAGTAKAANQIGFSAAYEEKVASARRALAEAKSFGNQERIELRERQIARLENYRSRTLTDARVIPLLARLGNVVELPDLGRWDAPDAFLKYAGTTNYSENGEWRPVKENTLPKAVNDKLVAWIDGKDDNGMLNSFDSAGWKEVFRKTLTDAGIDTIAYKNTAEDAGSTSYLFLDPSQLRSVNAAFDPALSKEGNLMYSARMIATPEFKRWFGDSKMVDENGAPLVFWHGSPTKGFNEFDLGKINPNDPDSPYNGFWFSSDKYDAESAGMFPWGRPNATDAEVRPFYLALKNPATKKQALSVAQELRNNNEDWAVGARSLQDAVRMELQKRGFDGVIHRPREVMDQAAFERDGVVKVGQSGYWLSKHKDGSADLWQGEPKRGEHILNFGSFRAAADDMSQATVVAFNPTQIKSAAANTGAFDPTNPRIDMSARRVEASLRPTVTTTKAPSYVDLVQGRELEKPHVLTVPLRKFVGALPGESLRSAFVRNVVNRAAPGWMIDRLAKEKGLSLPSVGMAMEVSLNNTGRIEMLVKHGPMGYDPKTGNVFLREDVPGILAAMRGRVDPQNKRELGAYLIALRDRDLRRAGREGFTNISDAQVDAAITDLERRFPAFKDVATDMQKINKALLKFAVDTGTLTAEKAADLGHMFYTPFYRLAEQDGQSNPGEAIGPRVTDGLTNLKTAFDTSLKGGDGAVGDVFENIIRNADVIMRAGLKNVAMKTASDVMGQVGLGEVVKTKGDKTITYREAGKDIHFRVDDNVMFATLAGAPRQFTGGVYKTMSNMAGFFREMITAAPGFMLANIWRGKIMSYVQEGLSFWSNTADGLKQALKGSTSMTAIAAQTGFGGYAFGMNEKSQAKHLEYLLGGGTKAVRAWHAVLNPLQKFSEASEMAERVKLMEHMMSKGMTEKEAAFQAYLLTPFSRKGMGGGWAGATMHWLTPLVPFLNAKVQGLYRLVENEKGDKQSWKTGGLPKQIMMRGLVLMAFSVAAAVRNMTQEPDKWDALPLHEKLAYDVILQGDKKFMIPRAFEPGTVFGAIPTMLLDAVRQDSGRDVASMLGQAAQTTFFFNPIPQALVPVLSAVTNYDFFRGRALDTKGDMSKMPAERFNPGTSTVAKQLGKLVDYSPQRIQSLLEGYSGSLGAKVLAGVDALLDVAGVTPARPAGPFGSGVLGKVAGAADLNRFVRDQGQSASRFVGEYYDLKEQVEQLVRSRSMAIQVGDHDRIKELQGKEGLPLMLRPMVNNANQQLTQIGAQVRRLNARGLSSDELAKQLAPLNARRDEVTHRVVQRAREMGVL